MWLKKITSAKFLKKFSKFSLIGLSLLLILFSASTANSDLLKRGPKTVQAQADDQYFAGDSEYSSGGFYPDSGSQYPETSFDSGSQYPAFDQYPVYDQYPVADSGSAQYPVYDSGPTNGGFYPDSGSQYPVGTTFVSDPGPQYPADGITYVGDPGPQYPVEYSSYSQPQPQPVQAQAPINYPMRPGSYNVTSTGPVYNPPVYNPPIYQTRSNPQRAGSVYNPVTYTYTYDSHNSVDSHNRSTSTVDSHNRTRIDDHSISGSFNDQRRNDQSQTLTVSAPQGGVAAGQSMGSNYLYTAPNTTLSYPYPFANPAYMAPMTQQVVTYPMKPAPQYQHPQMATYAVSNPYPVYTTQAAPVYASQPVYVQDPNISKTVIVDTQPKVVTVAATDASNLPKTGLPLAGLGLGALLPIGLKMRKIGRLNFSESYITPNSLWQERQSQLTI